jgi:hypothetical protein
LTYTNLSDVLYKCWPSHLTQHEDLLYCVTVTKLGSRSQHFLASQIAQDYKHVHPIALLWTYDHRSSQRLLRTQHTTNKTDKRRCPQRDSNWLSHQSSGFRTTTSTAWPPVLASGGQNSIIELCCSFCRVPLMWATINPEDVQLSEMESIGYFVKINR